MWDRISRRSTQHRKPFISGGFRFRHHAHSPTIRAAAVYRRVGCILDTGALASELLQRPDRDLRHEHAPFAKGMLAFDALTSIGYGAE